MADHGPLLLGMCFSWADTKTPNLAAGGVSVQVSDQDRGSQPGQPPNAPPPTCAEADAARQGEFVEDVLDSIGNVVKVERAKLPHSVRDKGKWRSITVRVPVESAQQ
eukprot:3935044-Rhodomonas_salina.2